ncbi:MAG: hypothetical protein IT318_15350 [Anaerolineales bacterium]|nr:hypothetical protein [Anaerolineales bacterium]
MPLPPRYGMGVAAANDGLIYLAGGDSYTNVPLTVVHAFNPISRHWTTRASMPTGRWSLALVAGPDGRLYALGGTNCGPPGFCWQPPRPVGTVEAYDPATNQWSTRQSMPTARTGLVAAVGNDGLIYAIGGQDVNGEALATVEAYNPATNSWSTRADMPTARAFLEAVTVDGLIFAVGGNAGGGVVQVYDATADSWSTRARMPLPAADFGLAAANGQLVAAGGQAGGFVTTVQAYDIAADRWQLDSALSVARRHPGMAAGSDGRLYVFGGWGPGGPGYGGAGPLSSVEVGTPGQPGATKPVVVLVHGWHGTSRHTPDECRDGGGNYLQPYHVTSTSPAQDSGFHDFGSFAHNLLADGWDIWLAHVETGPDHTPPLGENAACLQWQLAQIPKPGGKAVLIGHSMGGLVIRAYVESALYRDDVSRIVTLGTPHAGTPFGHAVCLTNALPWRSTGHEDLAACEFATGGDGYIGGFNQGHSQRRAGVAYHFIGGDRNPIVFGQVLQYLGLEGPNDGVVGAQSSLGRIYWPLLPPSEFVPGATRHILDVSHSGKHWEIAYPVIDWQNLRLDWRPYVVEAHRWYPSYFNASADDNTSMTDSYACLRNLIGWPLLGYAPGYAPGACPIAETVPLTAPPEFQQDAPVWVALPARLGQVATGETVTYAMPIDTSGFSLFELGWEAGTVDFTLIDPLGVHIDPAYAANHPNEMIFQQVAVTPGGQTWASYAMTVTQPGTYTLTAVAADVGPGTDYAMLISVDSPRILTAAPDRPLYAIGDTSVISATLQDGGVVLDGATVTARVYRSTGGIDEIPLTSQGGGRYAGSYSVPNSPGLVPFTVQATGLAAGQPFVRQTSAFLGIAPGVLQLSGQYSALPQDQDGNGKVEWLDVRVGFTATQTSSYLLAGDLVDAQGNLVAHSVISVTVPAGTTSVVLPFNGDDIRRSGANGFYTLTNFTASDQRYAGLPAVIAADNVWVTGPYSFASFAAHCYLLVLNASGGVIQPGPLPDCNNGQQYTLGTTVSLVPMPDSGQSFSGWSGDVLGTTVPITLTMDGDKTVQANFVQATTTSTATPSPTLTPTSTSTTTPSATPSATAAPLAVREVYLPLARR